MRRITVLVLAVVISALFAMVGSVALASAFGLIKLPYEMALMNDRMPVLFPLHMATSAGALMLLPAAIVTRHQANLHRTIGWLLGALVVFGGLSAFPVALFSHSNGIARVGFAAQACVWLALLGAGLLAIRSAQRKRHVLMMVAMAAVTTGAVWFRMTIGIAIWMQLPFEPVYAAAAWTSWLIPLALVVVMRDRLYRWAFTPSNSMTQRLWRRHERLAISPGDRVG